MRVAITGANGFLGKHLVSSLLASGYTVIAIVRKSADTSELPKKENLTIHSIDYEQLDELLVELKKSGEPLDFFIHNAAITVAFDSKKYFEVNTNLTGRVIEAVKAAGVLQQNGKLVFISSYAAHGPYNLSKPVSSYGKSKLRAEQLVRNSGLNYLIIRPTGIYGPCDAAFLPLFKLAKKGLYLLSTSKDQKLSMIHASDLALAIIRLFKTNEVLIHVSDGNVYTHHDLKKALEVSVGNRIGFLKIPRFLSIFALSLITTFQKLLHSAPQLTTEKFRELSQNWNLSDDQALAHYKGPIHYTLSEGFKNTYEYYLEKKLIK